MMRFLLAEVEKSPARWPARNGQNQTGSIGLGLNRSKGWE
jgi:hypothetical protein